MSLSEIKKKLYQRNEEKSLSRHDESEYDVKAASDFNANPADAADLWEKKEKGLNLEQKKVIRTGMIALGAVLGIILLMVICFFVRKALFLEERVSVSIDGPKEAKSGNLITYEIDYTNNNFLDLKNATLSLTYPQDVRPENNPNFKVTDATSGTFEIGTVASHSSGKVTFNARMYNPKGALIYLKTELDHNSVGFLSRLSSANQLGINIVSSPISLELAAPQAVASGDQVDYLISYKNTSNEEYGGVRIRLEYPDGFTFSGSDPKVFEGGNVWYVGTLAPGQSGKIIASGKLEGVSDDNKQVKATVGTLENGEFISYNEEDASTKITSSPLTISQMVNGLTSSSINAGDSLNFELNYKNTGVTGLRDVIIKENIDSQILDYATLDLKNKGVFDEAKKTITWKASDFPELANLTPGKSGKVSFSVRAKSIIPVSGNNDKNFVVSSIAKIDSPDVPTPINSNKVIAGNRMDMRLNSKLVLDAKGYYKDVNIPNSGPIPPKVGQETTYTLHLIASNISNDVESAKVEAILPTSVTMTGAIFPEDANLKYNDRTNSITWDLGSLPAGTGVLTPAKDVSFQVKIKPTPDLIAREAPLLGSATFTAKDTFTGENLSVNIYQKTTGLTEDDSIGGRGYQVSK